MVLIAVVQILLTCVPFQIVSNCYAKILDIFYVIKDSFLWSIGSFDIFIRYLVISIILHLTRWNLIPHFLAQQPRVDNLYPPEVSQCPQFFFYFAITNAVVSKKAYLWVNVCSDIINIQREQQWSKNGALRVTWQNGYPIWFYSIYIYTLLPETEKSIYHFRVFPPISCIQVVQEEVCQTLSQRPSKCVNLSALIQDFSPIVYISEQLSITAMPLLECVLSIWQKFTFVQMCHDIRAYYVFKQLAWHKDLQISPRKKLFFRVSPQNTPREKYFFFAEKNKNHLFRRGFSPRNFADSAKVRGETPRHFVQKFSDISRRNSAIFRDGYIRT